MAYIYDDKPSAKDEVKRRLLQNIPATLKHLLPNGVVDKNKFYVGNIKGDPGRSLVVELSDPRAGLWQDFATNYGGDILRLWAGAKGLSVTHNLPEVLLSAQEWLCMHTSSIPEESSSAVPTTINAVLESPAYAPITTSGSDAKSNAEPEPSSESNQCNQMAPDRFSNELHSAKSVHERVSELNTNGLQDLTQMVSKRFPNGSKMVSKRFQNGSRIMETVPKWFPNGSQMVDRFRAFPSLSPHQRTLLKTLYLSTRANGDSTTPRLSLTNISELSGIGRSSVKTGIWRLRKKGLLETKEYKIGRDGWASYEIPQSVYFEICNSENGSQNGSQMVPKSPPAAPYSSSTLNINKRTTTTGGDAEVEGAEDAAMLSGTEQTSEAWKNIDIEPLSKIGLSQQHLQTLHAGGLANPQIIQESINRFAWGLVNNADAYKEYKNPLRPLIGVLRKGEAWIEPGYESPRSIALKEFIELKKKQRKQENQMIDELLEIEFPVWKESVGQEKLDEIAPNSSMSNASIRRTLWKEHFRKHVLVPKLKAKGLIEQWSEEMISK